MRSQTKTGTGQQPRALVMDAPGTKAKGEMPVRAWFSEADGCSSIARRSEVWGLLGWYHSTIVEPQLGFPGFLRRLWWRFTGQKTRLLSPWMQIRARQWAMAMAAQQQAELATRAEQERIAAAQGAGGLAE